jgi:hypothetical protein
MAESIEPYGSWQETLPNGDVLRPPLNPNAEIHLFGPEVNPEKWAVAKV